MQIICIIITNFSMGKEMIIIFKIAICDDDKKICDELKIVLNQIATFNGFDFNITIFNSGENFYNFFIEKDYDFDMVFLDI